jgi:NAD(P)H-hydrate epimerase
MTTDHEETNGTPAASLPCSTFISQNSSSALTREQVRRVDQIAIDRFHIPGIILMENAARGVVEAATAHFLQDRDKRVLILCGGGNNGGDGLAVARHLHNLGHAVSIGLLTDPARYKGDAEINWRIVQAMSLRATPATPEWIRQQSAGLIIDAIFGTGLSAAPRDPFPQIVQAINTHPAPVLAIDVPSGLDCNTGQPFSACIRADLTVTFVAKKAGFASESAKEFLGKVLVAGIGCPAECIAIAATGES